MVIGIMGAMPAEVDLLCQKLSGVTQEEYAGVTYHRGALAGKQVVVCCAGMGKANAAATVQVLWDATARKRSSSPALPAT